jgi:hypothetical protein
MPPQFGRGNDFADLLLNRSKLFLERSQFNGSSFSELGLRVSSQ